MGYPGYAGGILYIDLSTGGMRVEPLDPHLVKAFIPLKGEDGKEYPLMDYYKTTVRIGAAIHPVPPR